MLNGSHSTPVYPGLLKVHKHVRDLSGDKEMEEFLLAMMAKEVIPNMQEPEGIDLVDYSHDLMARFKNPALLHELRQIASDGSQKLPQRILDSIAENLVADRSSDRLLRVVAAWICCNATYSNEQQAFDISDPLSERFRGLALHNGRDVRGLVRSFLALRSDFDPEVWGREHLQKKLIQEIEELVSKFEWRLSDE